MKVCFVAILFEPSKGVENKLKYQADEMSLINEDFHFYLLANFKANTGDNVVVVPFKQKNNILYKLKRLFTVYYIIANNIPTHKYDAIVLRYPGATISGIHFMKSNTVFIEHHTKEITEFKSQLSCNLLSPRNLYLLIKIIIVKMFGRYMINNAKGLLCMTHEILKYELIRGKEVNAKPNLIIGNGISIPANQIKRKPFNSKSIDFVLVASSYQQWHGIERIIESMNKYKGATKLNFHLVGNCVNDKIKGSENVKLHGSLFGIQLENLLSQMDFAFSTMALFKKGMQEAVSLKTREYLALGLPIVMAYSDTDLLPSPPFVLELPNNDDTFKFEEIIEFLNKTKTVTSTEIRDFAMSKLSWKSKMKNLNTFVIETLQ